MSGGRQQAGIASIQPLGESAVLIELTGTAAAERAAAVAARLRSEPPAGVLDAVAAYETVAAYFDPLASRADELTNALAQTAASDIRSVTASPVVHELPVLYDGEDLGSVAARSGLTQTEVVAIHSSIEYSVLALGFVPGFAYLGELDERLHIPRRVTPRTRVPAGAIAIAGAHTAVYPLATPGGWHLLGHTTASMFDASRFPPALLAVGDRVRFTPL